MGVCTSAGKGNRPTTIVATNQKTSKSGKFKLSDIEVGKKYTKQEINQILYDLTGWGSDWGEDNIKSVKNLVSLINHNQIYSTLNSDFDKDSGKSASESQRYWFTRNINKSELLDLKYNKSLGGYVFHSEDNSAGRVTKSDLEPYGYSFKTVTRDGVMYAVVTKKRKLANGRTRYEIMK